MAVESILVRALGPLEVGSGHDVVSLGGSRQRGLLAVLVARAGQMVPMDDLITGVWGEEPPASARKTVQGYAAVLRREVEPHGVRIESTPGGGYRLANGRAELDIAVFEDLVSAATAVRASEPGRALELLADAGRLWRGRAFADLTDVPGIEPFVIHLEERRRSWREQLLDLEIDVGDVDRAVAELEVFTREDPWRELPWVLLMTGQFRQGRQAEALRSYERMRVLWAEAGLSPTSVLREASNEISADRDPRRGGARRSTSPTTVVVSPAADLPEPWPLPAALRRLVEPTSRFVGRRAELAEGAAALATAGTGSRQIVLVSGEPGAGKTRLCAELASVAADTDTVVLLGGAEDGLGVPFQPLVETLDQLADIVGADSLARWSGPHATALGLLSERFGAAPVGNDLDRQRFALFAATTAIVRELTDRRPVLWVLDDLQWASRPMCQLLAHLFRALPDASLTVAVTYRDTDLGPGHPLAQLVADCRRTHGLHELHLGGLDDADLLELVGDSLVETVRARAGGNPFFVTELARNLREGLGQELPAIDDVVLRRVHRLAEPVVEVLLVAAVFGLRFPVQVIAIAMGLPVLDVADRLDRAVDAGLAETLPGPTLSYGFPHALVRDAINGSLRTAERLRSHLALARALDSIGGETRTVVSDLAYHWVRAAPAGYTRQAVAACRRAARSARTALGLDEAITHLERALAVAVADPTAPGRDRAELLVELARANGDAGRSTAMLERAVEACEVGRTGGLDDVVVASALVIRSGMTLTAVAGDRRANTLLKAGLELAEPHSTEQLMLRAKRTTTNFFVMDVDALATAADEMLDAATASGDRDVVRAVAEDVAWYARQGQHHRCVQLLRDAVDPADPLTELPYFTQALDERYESGDGAGFRELFAVFAQRAAGSVLYSVAAAFGTATLALLDGDLDRALRQARAARRLGMADRRVSVVTTFTVFNLHIAWLRGRLDRVARLADWAWHDQPHPPNEALRAWAHAARGDAGPLDAFVANFGNIDRVMLISARFTGGSLAALTRAAVLTNRRPALDLANELWGTITEPFHGGFFPPDLAVSHYRGMLAHAGGDLDEAADQFRKAVHDHHGIGAPVHEAVSRRALAEVLTRRGRAGDTDEIRSLQQPATDGAVPAEQVDLASSAPGTP